MKLYLTMILNVVFKQMLLDVVAVVVYGVGDVYVVVGVVDSVIIETKISVTSSKHNIIMNKYANICGTV